MKRQVKISRGIEPLFGTRDENIRLLETALHVSTQLLQDSLEIEGEAAAVERAAANRSSVRDRVPRSDAPGALRLSCHGVPNRAVACRTSQHLPPVQAPANPLPTRTFSGRAVGTVLTHERGEKKAARGGLLELGRRGAVSRGAIGSAG